MTTNGHTRGDWTVNGSAIECELCGSNVRGHGTSVMVAHVYGEERCIDDAEQRANAELMAAAPDLLAALFVMVDTSQCRANNTAERKMLSDRFAELGRQYRPLLAKLGASPFIETQ